MKLRRSKISRYQFNNKGELRCSICGALVNVIPFKSGYICDSCLQYVKTI